MHPFELKIIDFMKTVGKTSVKVDDLLLKPASKDVDYFLQKIYEDDPNRPFTIRMSNIGRPLCQLQMEMNKAEAVDDDWNLPLKFMYGAVIEGLTVSVLKHSGIKVLEEQTPVALDIGGIKVKGTLDLVLEDDAVWDIKSASEYSYRNKFASYESLKEQDDFGYLGQLFGYAKAANKKPGGFIVINKSSAEVKVCSIPEQYQEDSDACLTKIAENIKVLTSNGKFQRQFEDKPETFKKRFTGNKVLESPCTFCRYKYACWPKLQHLPSLMSAAYEKPYKYYTEITNENK